MSRCSRVLCAHSLRRHRMRGLASGVVGVLSTQEEKKEPKKAADGCALPRSFSPSLKCALRGSARQKDRERHTQSASLATDRESDPVICVWVFAYAKVRRDTRRAYKASDACEAKKAQSNHHAANPRLSTGHSHPTQMHCANTHARTFPRRRIVAHRLCGAHRRGCLLPQRGPSSFFF